MAQRIVTLCDQHQAQGEDVPGVTWRLAVQAPGEKLATWEVDACSECAKPFADLATFLADLGRPVDGTPRKARPAASDVSEADLTCPLCQNVYRNLGSLRGHVRNQHDMTMAQARGEVAAHPCPECSDGFDTPQGLGAHRKSTHGVVGSSKAAAKTRRKPAA